MDAINIEHGEGDQAGERPEAGCVLSDKTDSSTQNSSDEATSGSAISSLDDAVLTNSVGSGRIKYGSISSHHGGNDSSPSLYSANALLSGSDGRMSFVSGRESQSSPQKDGNLNSPLPFQMEQHPAVEDNEKRSSLLRQIEAACVPEARSTDKTDTSSKSSSSSKGACAAIGLEQDMSLMVCWKLCKKEEPTNKMCIIKAKANFSEPIILNPIAVKDILLMRRVTNPKPYVDT